MHDKGQKNHSRHKTTDVTTLFSRFPSADNTPLVPLGLTAVGVAPLLQVRVALQAAVGRRDVLGRAGDGRLRHDRVGLRRLVHGLELQPLVVDPQVGRLQVFGVALVLVGAVGRLGGGSLPAGDARRRRRKRRTKRLFTDTYSHFVEARFHFFLLFLVGCCAARAQEGPHHHHDDGEGAHGDDDDDDQDVTLAVASDP